MLLVVILSVIMLGVTFFVMLSVMVLGVSFFVMLSVNILKVVGSLPYQQTLN
jgi:hypothetical protein